MDMSRFLQWWRTQEVESRSLPGEAATILSSHPVFNRPSNLVEEEEGEEEEAKTS